MLFLSYGQFDLDTLYSPYHLVKIEQKGMVFATSIILPLFLRGKSKGKELPKSWSKVKPFCLIFGLYILTIGYLCLIKFMISEKLHLLGRSREVISKGESIY